MGIAAILGGSAAGVHRRYWRSPSALRAQISSGLDHLGVRVWERRDLTGDSLIFADESPVAIEAMETGEEQMIAWHTRRTLGEGADPSPGAVSRRRAERVARAVACGLGPQMAGSRVLPPV